MRNRFLEISFTKYHGCGNDFIVIDELDGEVVPEELKGRISKNLCQRRFSIGADDVLYIGPSRVADARMRVFEPDGSEADMCGNGVRCVAAHTCSKLDRAGVSIETRAGIRQVTRRGTAYRVYMGKLIYTRRELGALLSPNIGGEDLIDIKMAFPDLGELELSIVNTGEPHVVIFVDDVDKEDLHTYGRLTAMNKELFPEGTNLNLAQVLDDETIKIRTYERGVWDETLACGTGATACAAVSHITGRTRGDIVKVHVKGGELIIELLESGLYMTGPASKVYTGKTILEIDCWGSR